MKKISTFRDRLNELMERKGVSAVELADATGIPAPTISRYRKGVREPVSENIELLASYFDVHVGYMMGYEEKQNSSEQQFASERREVLYKRLRSFDEKKLDLLEKLWDVIEADIESHDGP